MIYNTIITLFVLGCWAIFYAMMHKDRSRYRNCYALFIALIATALWLVLVAGDNGRIAFVVLMITTLVFILIVPFFYIINGIVMLKREGLHLAHMLSLGLGIIILLGEVVTIANILALNGVPTDMGVQGYYHSVLPFLASIFSLTIIYGSMTFLIFLIYILFLQVVPRKKDFDYIIIHGAGLIHGDRVSKLLSDRIDKALEIYHKAPNSPKLIPSGGKGSDETVSEAEAMKNYMVQKGIPEEDIIMEDKSETTYENLKNSQDIIDSREGRKYTALVTSNYHVYRALRYCRKIGLKCTGIGSHVAFYYWPSATIREFIAIHAEKKHAIIFALGWLFLVVMHCKYIFW